MNHVARMRRTGDPPNGASRGGVIVLDQLGKRFGTVTAVQSFSLAIQPGEFLTLLGPSGSGKTTTLMMIAGFEAPSSGEVWLDGQRLSRLPAYRRNLGMVFQNYALFPHLTVFENVAFPLKMRQQPRTEIQRRVTEALALVKLSGYEARLPNQLSGGQQQRVALARALVFSPRVVLMDEPLGALDKQLRDHMQLEIRQLQRTLGMTVLYVTHDQGEALTMSDRIVVMNGGRPEQIGTPEQVYENPATRFVAGFLGESNFLEGELVEPSGGDGCAVRVGDRVLRVARRNGDPHRGPVTVVVRPEKVLIDTRDEGVDNVFPGTIDEAVYYGSYGRYRIVLEATPGVRVVATRPIRDSFPRLESGQRVSVAWSSSDARIVGPAQGLVSEAPSTRHAPVPQR